jgi:hypothetical protein
VSSGWAAALCPSQQLCARRPLLPLPSTLPDAPDDRSALAPAGYRKHCRSAERQLEKTRDRQHTHSHISPKPHDGQDRRREARQASHCRHTERTFSNTLSAGLAAAAASSPVVISKVLTARPESSAASSISTYVVLCLRPNTRTAVAQSGVNTAGCVSDNTPAPAISTSSLSIASLDACRSSIAGGSSASGADSVRLCGTSEPAVVLGGVTTPILL